MDDGKNFSEGMRPRCPASVDGGHDDVEERMYGFAGGKRREGKTLTCKKCGMKEFIIIQ